MKDTILFVTISLIFCSIFISQNACIASDLNPDVKVLYAIRKGSFQNENNEKRNSIDVTSQNTLNYVQNNAEQIKFNKDINNQFQDDKDKRAGLFFTISVFTLAVIGLLLFFYFKIRKSDQNKHFDHV